MLEGDVYHVFVGGKIGSGRGNRVQVCGGRRVGGEEKGCGVDGLGE